MPTQTNVPSVSESGFIPTTLPAGSIVFSDGAQLTGNVSGIFWDNPNSALRVGLNDAFAAGPIRISNFGAGNTFCGSGAGNFTLTYVPATSGFSNTGFGALTLANLTTGYNNAGFGYSLAFCTSGFQNTAIGDDACQTLTTSHDNTCVGYNTLTAITTTGKSNFNVAMGSQALQNKTDNTSSALGFQAGLTDTTGAGCTYIGFQAGNLNSIGNGVTAIGDSSLLHCTNSWNTALGYFAGYSQTNPTGNTYIGYFAGYTLTAANANVTGGNNTYLGYNTGPNTTTQLSNATALGANALCSASNQMVLGASVTDIIVPQASSLEWGTPGGTIDLFVSRDGPGIIAVKNASASNQAVRVYGSTGSKYVQMVNGGTNGQVDVIGGGVLFLGGTGSVEFLTNVGFYSTSPVAQQASGANLTNNVTVGGTTDTIANFTDLVTYSNDAAAIRNDIYQLSRKLKQVNDALRLYGLLT